ncbi:hypothetical protein H0264_08185 [Nocardia huaxiensis]|uniref:Uncharacterized protein n=1 Tax=Nocardia huaxiensis TaxID=2755382 RepID=A0A7D6VGF5_9NOCA|nr:hypothetical protein [Nocardia huaxiensis]QLY32237.1 hypothetical protein H0264_08185 [Nocardia huaxiensis]
MALSLTMGTVGFGMWDLAFPPGPPDRIADMVTAAVVADAVRPYDADLAQSVETSRDWRRTYHRAFRGMTALAVSSPTISTGIATQGLHSVRTMLRFATLRTVTTLDEVDVDAAAAGAELDTEKIDGAGTPVRRLEIPFHGRVLAEDELRRQLDDWRQCGILEPGFVTAVHSVVDNPEWLRLPGFRMTVLGATADLGPLQPLLSWGAEVLAVDRPGRKRWIRLREVARAGAGTLRFPVTSSGPGVDIVKAFPALTHWIVAHTDARPVLGMYATAPGAAGVRLAAATDVLADHLLRRDPAAALACLGASTDCYGVPAAVVAAARERLSPNGFRGATRNLLHRLAPRSLYSPNYTDPVVDAAGESWGLFDNLPFLSGPDYALAQRLPRWRAVLAQAAAHPVSYTVIPPTWTDLRHETPWRPAAYRAATHFGIEVFEPEVIRLLLAAKLVGDLFAPPAPTPNPESLFADGAAHGGLWRQPFAPRSLVAPATLTGYVDGIRDFGERHLRSH